MLEESSQLSAGVSAAGAKVPVPNQLSWATDCEAFSACVYDPVPAMLGSAYSEAGVMMMFTVRPIFARSRATICAALLQ